MVGREENVRDWKNGGGGGESVGIKSRRGILVGKGGGGRESPSTPPPTWAFHHHISSLPPTANKPCIRSSSSSVSARRLGAALWEIFTVDNVGSALCRRHYPDKNKGLKIEPVCEDPDDESEDPREERITEKLIQHHRSVNTSVRAMQLPAPSATCTSSTEVTPFNSTSTPTTSSPAFMAKIGDSSYSSMKTSTELLRILNRIWSVEEQSRSNMALVKALRVELDYARARIKDLVKEKQRDEHVIDNLIKRASGNKSVRKNMTEQERIKSVVQSARKEAEDERMLRKQSEGLQQKLFMEVNEVKCSLNRVLSELHRERKSRILLEELCDEFALCIRDYDKELRSLKHKYSGKGQSCRDHLVLHMSEAWLDKRAQKKPSDGGKNRSVEELGSEIETFLKARRRKESPGTEVNWNSSVWHGRHSLESYLNEAGSAPKNAGDDDVSAESFSNYFVLNKSVDAIQTNDRDKDINAILFQARANKDVELPQEFHQVRSSSSLQARLLQHMSRATDGKAQVPAKKEPAADNHNGSHGSLESDTRGDGRECARARRNRLCGGGDPGYIFLDTDNHQTSGSNMRRRA